MIRTMNNESEVIQFIELLLAKGYCCPMLNTLEQLKKNLLKVFEHPNDFVLGAYEEGRLVGVFSFLVEPEERYIEMIAALSTSDAACKKAIEYLRQNYSGYKLDCVIHPTNSAVRLALEEYGASFYPMQIRMRLKEQIHYKHNHTVIPFSEEYRSEYLAIHDTDCYWTGERVLASQHIFQVFLALENNRAVGYIDVTHVHSENEIYNMFVRKEHRFRGMGKALLEAALNFNGNKGMILEVDEDNLPAIHAFRRMGFEKVNGEESITASLSI